MEDGVKEPSKWSMVGLVWMLSKFMNISFFVNLMIASSVELVVGAVVNLRDFWIAPFTVFVNSVIALVVFFMFFWLIRVVFLKSLAIENFKMRENNLVVSGKDDELNTSQLGLLKDKKKSKTKLRTKPHHTKVTNLNLKDKIESNQQDKLKGWDFLKDNLKPNITGIPSLIF